MLKVGIVDDHQSVRETYQKALEEVDNIQVIGTFASADLADLWCKEHNPDLLLMDICTAGNASGLDATQKIKSTMPHIKIIVMTGFDEVSYVKRAMEVGADGFVYKSKSFEYLLNVIKVVVKDGKVFPETKSIPTLEGEGPLTERELEVLRLLCKNYSRKEIAEQLFVSESTVKRHLSRMMEKTGMNNSVSLAVHMVSQGYINPNF